MRILARSTMPVKPMPATVAQNNSASEPSGVSVVIDPSALSKSMEIT